MCGQGQRALPDLHVPNPTATPARVKVDRPRKPVQDDRHNAPKWRNAIATGCGDPLYSTRTTTVPFSPASASFTGTTTWCRAFLQSLTVQW